MRLRLVEVLKVHQFRQESSRSCEDKLHYRHVSEVRVSVTVNVGSREMLINACRRRRRETRAAQAVNEPHDIVQIHV